MTERHFFCQNTLANFGRDVSKFRPNVILPRVINSIKTSRMRVFAASDRSAKTADSSSVDGATEWFYTESGQKTWVCNSQLIIPSNIIIRPISIFR